MFSVVSSRWKVAGVVLVGCLALGVMLGVIVPKEQAANSVPQPENMLRGTLERRLIEADEVVMPEELRAIEFDDLYSVPEAEEIHTVKERLPPASRLDVSEMMPADIVWPDESKAVERGTGLWGSDEDEVWGAKEKMWARQEINKVWGADILDDVLSYTFDPDTNDFSYDWSTPVTNDFSYEWDPITNDFSMDFSSDWF